MLYKKRELYALCKDPDADVLMKFIKVKILSCLEKCNKVFC